MYSAVYLGLALTFVTAVVLGLGLMQLSKDRVTGLAAAALVLVLLCVSDSWRSFQTSGLEGSLSTLLVVLFVLALSREEVRPPALFLIASLLVLCRPDFALIAAPVCIYAALEVWRSKRWLTSALALAPLVWFVFAKAYYGDFLPNTGAAKLGTFTLSQGFDQGLTYLGDWVTNEPLTATAAFTLLAFALSQARRRWEFLLFFGMTALLLLRPAHRRRLHARALLRAVLRRCLRHGRGRHRTQPQLEHAAESALGAAGCSCSCWQRWAGRCWRRPSRSHATSRSPA